jgi:hypothetical protein
VHLAHREPGVERGAERREALHGERASMRLDATGSWPASNRKRPKDSSPRSTNPGGARGSFHPYGAEGLAAAVEVSACWQSLAVVWMDQTAGASAAGRVEAVPASCANNRAPTTEVGRDGVGAERGDEPGRVRRVELASPGPLGTRGRGSATRQGSDRDPLGACMTSTHSTIRPSARPQPSTVRQSRRPPGPPVTKTHFRQCDEQAFVGTGASPVRHQGEMASDLTISKAEDEAEALALIRTRLSVGNHFRPSHGSCRTWTSRRSTRTTSSRTWGSWSGAGFGSRSRSSDGEGE